jgi:transposase
MVRHPATGKYRRTRLFVFTLGYSRKSVRPLTFTSSARRWAELHEEAFRRLGAAVATVVLDNLKEGVLTPDVCDPTLNPLFRDVLAHYGAVALPCRVGHADRKGNRCLTSRRAATVSRRSPPGPRGSSSRSLTSRDPRHRGSP